MTTLNKEVVVLSNVKSLERSFNLTNSTINSIIGHPAEFHSKNAYSVSDLVVRNRQELSSPELLIDRTWNGVTMNVTEAHNLGISNPTTPALRISGLSGVYIYNIVPFRRGDFDLSNMSTCKQHVC